MSRIDIPINDPTTAFNILIPITFTAHTNTNMYIGYQRKDSTTGKKSLSYIEIRRDIGITSTLSTSGSYGPVIASATVGSTISNMGLRAYSGGSITLNAGDSIGGGFSYFS